MIDHASVFAISVAIGTAILWVGCDICSELKKLRGTIESRSVVRVIAHNGDIHVNGENLKRKTD